MIKIELLDAGDAYFPSDNAKKYGDVKNEAQKKKCKKVYKLLNFDPWNEATRYDDDDLCDYVLENPEGAKIKFEFEGFSGCIYPFSMCYALKASRDTVEVIYDAHPAALTETDYWIGTPYHYAAVYGAPPEIVEFLILKNKKGVEEPNYYGRTPLALGALFRAPLATMELFTSKYPTAARIKDKDGYIPLHHACEHGAESGVVKLLIECYPPSVYVAAQYGMMPLHFACSRQSASVNSIRALLEAAGDNSLCKATDMSGHTALHMALMGLAPYEVIELLIAWCPESVWVKTDKKELPLEIAQRKRASAEVLEILEKMMERLLVEQDK